MIIYFYIYIYLYVRLIFLSSLGAHMLLLDSAAAAVSVQSFTALNCFIIQGKIVYLFVPCVGSVLDSGTLYRLWSSDLSQYWHPLEPQWLQDVVIPVWDCLIHCVETLPHASHWIVQQSNCPLHLIMVGN